MNRKVRKEITNNETNGKHWIKLHFDKCEIWIDPTGIGVYPKGKDKQGPPFFFTWSNGQLQPLIDELMEYYYGEEE